MIRAPKQECYHFENKTRGAKSDWRSRGHTPAEILLGELHQQAQAQLHAKHDPPAGAVSGDHAGDGKASRFKDSLLFGRRRRLYRPDAG